MAKKANIRRRGNSWIVYFRADGGQVFKSFADRKYGGPGATKEAAQRASKDAALLFLSKSQTDVIGGSFRIAPVRLFGEFATEHLASPRAGLRPRTRELYEQRLRDYLLPTLEHRKIGEIDVTMVLRVLDRVAATGASGSTQRGCLNLLSGILRAAVRQKLIAANPVRELEASDRPKIRKGRKRSLTAAELGRLLAASGRFKTLFALAACAGLRLSEVLALTWADIDFEHGTIRVVAQLSVPNRYDRTPARRVEPKSDSEEGSDRMVFLDDDLAGLLKAHRGDRIVRDGDYVFTTSTAKPFSQRNVGRAFDAALAGAGIEWTIRCEACGLSVAGPVEAHNAAKSAHVHAGDSAATWVHVGKPSFHSLRHAFASAVIAGGANAAHLARMIGHTDPGFTAKVYVHEFDRAQELETSKQALGKAYAGVLGV